MALLHAVGFQPGIERWNIDGGLHWDRDYVLADEYGEWESAATPKLIYLDGRYPNTYGINMTSGDLSGVTGIMLVPLERVFELDSTVIIGFGFRYNTNHPYVERRVLGLRTGTGTNVVNSLMINTEGRLYFSTQPDNSRSTVVGPSWNYVEVKVKISNTDGSLELRLNGQTELFWDNIDTSSQTNVNTYINRIEFRTAGIRSTLPDWREAISDVYICDDTGPDNNDFLGDVVVQTLRPNANGSVSDLMGSDGNQVNNFALVNAINPTAENYVESAVVGDRDLYNMQNLALPGDVLAVQSKISASKDGVGFGTMRSVLSNGTSESFGVPNALSTGDPVLKRSTVFERDPDNLYWTEQSVNDLQVGVEVGDV